MFLPGQIEDLSPFVFFMPRGYGEERLGRPTCRVGERGGVECVCVMHVSEIDAQFGFLVLPRQSESMTLQQQR